MIGQFEILEAIFPKNLPSNRNFDFILGNLRACIQIKKFKYGQI